MERRSFNLLGAASIATLAAARSNPALAAVSADKAAQLKTNLTPLGAERAGNADGSIPAWTGGYTQVPSNWQDGEPMPDFFASDAALLVINPDNLAQHTDMLSIGTANMIKKYGTSVKVYPTHRTAAAPQYVYDNTYQNAQKASLDPRGGKYGFVNGYGGVVFPILDEDPSIAGIQCIWNHLVGWNGYMITYPVSYYIAAQGSISLSANSIYAQCHPFYDPAGSAATYDGWLLLIRNDFTGPPVLVGRINGGWSPTDSFSQPTLGWSLLNGQGRVRQAPNLTYDTPLPAAGGIAFYDESNGFYGQPDKYDWKLLGKKEMYIPYNNNALALAKADDLLKPHFLNPDFIRYERHRVWIVDATLAPGERHSIPHRRFYIDEDNWHIACVDEWDANGNFWKSVYAYDIVMPNLPGTIYFVSSFHDLQADEYAIAGGPLGATSDKGIEFTPRSKQYWNSETWAASSQY